MKKIILLFILITFSLVVNADWETKYLAFENSTINTTSTFYEYDTDGSLSGDGIFRVYSQLNGTDYYVGIEISHFIDADAMVYVDYWRIRKAYIYLYRNGSMVDLSLPAISPGESEQVYHQNGKPDFTGGFHGNELVTAINVYVDKIRITYASDILLTACSEFMYIIKSTTHETSSDGVNPVVGHPTQATHEKRTIIKDGGYETYNRFIWTGIFELDIWYSGICCVAEDIVEFGQNENYDVTEFDGDNGNKIEEHASYIHYWSETVPYGVRVTSYGDINETTANQFVWDKTDGYKKYYRNSAYPSNYSTSENEVFESYMKVEFYRQKE